MPRRKPMTPEQHVAFEQRREQMRQLSKTIAAMSEADRQALAAQVGTILTCGEPPRQLSPYNTCMLVSQRPDATVVGGFQQWKRLGRAVKKGEKASYIWVPMMPSNGDDRPTRDGSEPDEQRFRLVAVFDVSQTQEEGDEETTRAD